MRNIRRYALAAAAACVIGGGVATGAAIATPEAPRIPTSCVAPLNNGGYKMVADGDAEQYANGVYVCAKGRWILDPNYGQ